MDRFETRAASRILRDMRAMLKVSAALETVQRGGVMPYDDTAKAFDTLKIQLRENAAALTRLVNGGADYNNVF